MLKKKEGRRDIQIYFGEGGRCSAMEEKQKKDRRWKRKKQ
jgi:hypothetical protein